MTDNWIHVDTATPSCKSDPDVLGTPVLIWPRNPGGAESDGFCYYGRRATGHRDFYLHGARIVGVTHWQPMPKGPVPMTDKTNELSVEEIEDARTRIEGLSQSVVNALCDMALSVAELRTEGVAWKLDCDMYRRNLLAAMARAATLEEALTKLVQTWAADYDPDGFLAAVKAARKALAAKEKP